MNKFLVSGGAGFIGLHLIRMLKAEFEFSDITIIDDNSTGQVSLLDENERRECVVEDVCNASFFDEYDVIFHLASPASPQWYEHSPINTLRVNTHGTEKLLELARDTGARLVFTSSSEIYGDPQQHPQTEDYAGNCYPLARRACYSEAKRFGETLIKQHVNHYGTDAVIARLFNSYGPGFRADDGRVVPNFVQAAIRDFPVIVNGDGSQTRSFCYVEDTVAGLIALAERGKGGEAYNIGNPEEMTIMDLAKQITKQAGGDKQWILSQGKIDSYEPNRRCPDISKAIAELDWKPEVDLEVGLDLTLEWARGQSN